MGSLLPQYATSSCGKEEITSRYKRQLWINIWTQSHRQSTRSGPISRNSIDIYDTRFLLPFISLYCEAKNDSSAPQISSNTAWCKQQSRLPVTMEGIIYLRAELAYRPSPLWVSKLSTTSSHKCVTSHLMWISCEKILVKQSRDT
jgi:hypothetical protein